LIQIYLNSVKKASLTVYQPVQVHLFSFFRIIQGRKYDTRTWCNNVHATRAQACRYLCI